MNKCQFCEQNTDNEWLFLPMIFPQEKMEILIDKWGRKDWFKNLEKDPTEFTPEENEELENLYVYDQALNTVSKGYSCNKCEEDGYELFIKYYDNEELSKKKL